MTMYLRRRVGFSAGDTGALTATPGGHNYICELTVGGEIDPVTGMVINITEIDAILKSRVVSVLDGTLLDRDVPYFQQWPASPVNIARFIWAQCVDRIPPVCKLERLTFWWTPTGCVTLSARDTKENGPMVTLTRAYDFSASHRLHAPELSASENVTLFGKCNRENGHGHNYEVEVTFAGEADPVSGELVPLGLVDAIIDEEVLTPFDHRHLNFDVPEFADMNPTSENLTKVIWDRLSARWGKAGHSRASLHRVVVRETPRNYFEYYGNLP